MALLQYHFFICMNSRPPGHPKGSCAEKGAAGVMNTFLQLVEQRNLWGKVKVTSSGCLGPCQYGPVVVCYPEGVWYRVQSPADVQEIMDQHVGEGKPVERLQFDPEQG